MRQLFLGIDVACGRGKPLPLCLAAEEDGRLTPLRLPPQAVVPRGPGNVEVASPEPFRAAAVQAAAAVAHAAAGLDGTIARVGVDAPAEPPAAGVRVAEAALARAGLSSFRTPGPAQWAAIRAACAAHLAAGKGAHTLPHANKIWMLSGFELFAALRRTLGAEVIETYPYAIVRALLPSCPHKSTPDGYRRQLAAVADATGWAAPELETRLRATVPGTRDDRLDAFMAAWVASLRPERRCAYGRPGTADAIWVPRIAGGTQPPAEDTLIPGGCCSAASAPAGRTPGRTPPA